MLGLGLDLSTVAVLGGAGVNAPYLGPVAGRTYYPDTTLVTTGTWMSRTSHIAMDNITALKLLFMQIAGIAETPAGASSTTTASVEYPVGVFTQVLFNGGSTQAVIASGATQLSDFATVTIPKGAQFWIRRYQATTALTYLVKTNGRPLNTSLGDAVVRNVGDLTMSGTITDNGSGAMIPVCGILGMTRLPTIGALGSSRMAGKLDQTLDSTGLYGYTRMFGGQFAFMDMAVGGEPFVGVATSTQGTLRRQLVNTYTSHLWLDPGLNDINSAVPASVVLSAINTAATAFPGGKARTIVNNEAPWTTSTDAWVTSVNQTPFAAEAQRVLLNSGIAALTGYNQIVDVASFMSNGTNGSLWNNPAVGGSQFTTDGTHEISAPVVALAASGRFSPGLVSRGAAPILGGRQLIVGDSFPGLNALAGTNLWTTYQSGYSVMLEVISQGKFVFDPNMQKGVAGRRSDEVLSAFSTDTSALMSSCDMGVVDVGRNDVTQYPLLSTAQSIANIKAICQGFLNANKPVLLFLPNPPRTDATLSATPATKTAQRQMMVDVNAAIRAWATVNIGVYLVDYETEWGGAGNAPTSNYTYDGLHPTRMGSYYAAKKALDTWGALWPARQNTPLYTNYNSSTNAFGNLISVVGSTVPTMTGTTGQKFNCTGSLATGYVFGRNSGSNADADITLSKETVGDGTFRQVCDFGPDPATLTGDFIGEVVGVGASFGSRPTTPAELVGKQVVIEYTLEILSNSGMSLPSVQMTARNNSVSVTSNGLSNSDSLAANVFTMPVGTYLIRSPPVTISAVDVTPTFWGNLIVSVLSASKCKFKITKPSINRVT